MADKPISPEIAELIQGLSSAVLKKDAKDLSKAQAEFLILCDMSSLPTELTINVSDTRVTETKFCTNTYGSSVKISLANVVNSINETVVAIEDPTEMIKKYLELKDVVIKFIQFKYASMESFLRDTSREAQKKDKITPVGRYIS